MSKNGDFAKSEITAMTHGQCSRADSPMPCQPGSPVLFLSRGISMHMHTYSVCMHWVCHPPLAPGWEFSHS